MHIWRGKYEECKGVEQAKAIITCKKLILKEGHIKTYRLGGFFPGFLGFLVCFVSFFTFHLICGVGVGKEGPLDDRLAGNRGWHVHVVGGVHVDGGGHLHDVLLVLRHVVGHLNATLNKDGVLHLVHLDLLLDDGGVVGDGSLEHGGDRDGKMGGGGLEDPGGVAGDKAGLAKVHLLGHHGGGLVDGGHALGLGGGGEGSRGGGRHIVDGVGHHGAGGVVVGTSGRVGGGSHDVGGDPVAGGGGHLGDGVCSWGLAQALAKMKESATKGLMLTVIFHWAAEVGASLDPRWSEH